jgi:short-chain fatty acids transporter
MSFSKRFETAFHTFVPSPFVLAIGLTVFVIGLSLIISPISPNSAAEKTSAILMMWYDGIWNPPFLVFAFQMMLILILGHAMALTPTAERLLERATFYCTNTAKAAAIVSLVCVTLGFLNWGMALIIGALFARKVAESAVKKGYKINYPLVAAAGYTGMMVWHGGLSGSSLIKVAESGHLLELTRGSVNLASIPLPDSIGLRETVFSEMNLYVILALLVLIPFGAYSIGKHSQPTHYILRKLRKDEDEMSDSMGFAERLDRISTTPLILGGLILLVAALVATDALASGSGTFVDVNYLNFLLLGFGLLGHGNIANYTAAIRSALPGAGGILIQFPLYFGIMGVMQNSGMISEITDFVVSISNEHTYFVNTFISAGLINILVPSGGGQWVIQGPVIVETAHKLGVPLYKSILAMAYGDQVTNMLQPFWALPLLSITGLRARDILPYTLYFMVLGSAIFILALLIF